MSFPVAVHKAQRVLALNWPVLIRLSIMIGVLALACAIGPLVVSRRVDPLLVAGGVAGLSALLLWRHTGQRGGYGLLAVVLSAGLLNFFTLSTGTQSRVVISMLLAIGLVGGWLLAPIFTKQRLHLKPSPINKPLLAFVAISVIAYAWGNVMRDPLVWVPSSWPVIQMAALTANTMLPLLALYVANKVTEVRWLELLAWTVLGIGTFVITSDLLRLPLDWLYFNGSRGLFALWVSVLAYALALFDRRLPVWMRALLLLMVGAWWYRNFIGNTLWLSGWVPMAVAYMVVTFARSKKLFLLMIVVLLIFVAANSSALYTNVVMANEDEGGLQRLELWRMNLELVANHPLFGVGPAGYAVYNMWYHPLDARSTHNNYFDVLAQTGVIGFAVFIWLWGAFLAVGNRTRRQLAGTRGFTEAFANATLAGCVGALIGMLLGDWVLPFAYNQTIAGFDNASFTWIFLGGMVALANIVGAPTAGDEPSAIPNSAPDRSDSVMRNDS